MDKDIKVTLKVWRQRGPKEKANLKPIRWKSTKVFLSWKCWIS